MTAQIVSKRPLAPRRAATVLAIGGVLAMANSSAYAGLLDFEHTPDGSTPGDNGALTTPYAIPGGTVRFFFDTNGNNVYDAGVDIDPHFEKVGLQANDGASGFRGTHSQGDTARNLPGLADQLGSWFLRKQGDIDTATPTPFVFLANYNTTVPIHNLSGEIWDIDSGPNGTTEQWLVEVLDSSNQVIASSLSPMSIDQADPASLDGRPWQFSFSNLLGEADKIRMTFVGTKEGGIGIAFNNFSPDVVVPEPASAALLALGGVALLRRRRMA